MTSKMTSNGHFRIGNRTCAFIWYFRVCRCIKQWRYLLNRWIIQEGDMTTITQKNSICQKKKIVKMTTEIISKRSQSKKMTDGFFSIYNLMINGRQRKLTLHYHQVLSLWLLWRQSWVHRNRDAFSFGLFFFALEAASKPKLIPAPPRPISSISTTISSLFLFHGFEC